MRLTILAAAVFGLFLALAVLLPLYYGGADTDRIWTDEEIRRMQNLRLSDYGVAAKNVSNELLYNRDAIELGERLFSDVGLSASGRVACATCHQPEYGYQDVNLATFRLDPSAPHRAPGLLGAALQDWFFWDGRADSLWSQSLASIENPSEHATSRLQAVKHMCAQYASAFPALLAPCRQVDLTNTPLHASPLTAKENWRKLSAAQQEGINKLFVKLGKSIAAFEAGLMPATSRFDLYVDAIATKNYARAATILNEKETAGLKLFLDAKVGCINCHYGAMFSNSGFFAIGSDDPNKPMRDRLNGVKLLLDSEFNCLNWNAPENCPKTLYVKQEGADLKGAYKTPSLRNLRYARAFMHDGRYKTLEEVIEHYQNPNILPPRHIDIRPAGLLPHQRKQLLSFLNTLGEEAPSEEIK